MNADFCYEWSVVRVDACVYVAVCIPNRICPALLYDDVAKCIKSPFYERGCCACLRDNVVCNEYFRDLFVAGVSEE